MIVPDVEPNENPPDGGCRAGFRNVRADGARRKHRPHILAPDRPLENGRTRGARRKNPPRREVSPRGGERFIVTSAFANALRPHDSILGRRLEISVVVDRIPRRSGSSASTRLSYLGAQGFTVEAKRRIFPVPKENGLGNLYISGEIRGLFQATLREHHAVNCRHRNCDHCLPQ